MNTGTVVVLGAAVGCSQGRPTTPSHPPDITILMMHEDSPFFLDSQFQLHLLDVLHMALQPS